MDAKEIKRIASGRWIEILQAAGLRSEILDGKGHPCPKCSGDDRFSSSKKVAIDGKVFCRGCFHATSTIRPGDGIASVAWAMGSTNEDAASWVGRHLGLDDAKPVEIDLIENVARSKRMPLEAFKLFNPVAETRGKLRVARVGVYNGSGEIHSYFDLTPQGKGWCKKGDGNSGMFFPGRLPQRGEAWCIVEGVKDAAALIGLGYNAAGLPFSFLADKYARLFNGVAVTCVADLDTTGQHGAQRSGGILSGFASSIHIARLPGEVKASNGEDVRDILRRPNGEQLVRDAIENAIPWVPSEGEAKKDDRPEVMVTLNEGFVADQVVKHLGKLGWESPWVPAFRRESVKVFSRGGVLVHTVESEDPITKGLLTIKPIPAAITRERITQSCQLLVEEVDGENIEIKPTRPTKWLIEAVHCRGHYCGHVKPLVGVTHAPTIRADGSILQIPGYDETTALLYRPSIVFPVIPDKPTKDDASAAFQTLIHVVVDFPFLAEADKTSWAALVLSMIGRSCFSGCVPLFAATANIRGSGKSYLIDSASLIAYGRTAARRTFTQDDNELRKAITAIALEAIPSVLFDNLDAQLGGASLDAVLTAESWTDRILSTSTTTGELPMRTVWSATGNNMAFGSDVARRVLPIRLQSELETPENRTGFVHPDLLEWVRVNRPALATAALTILRAYFVAGCPLQPDGSWGSYEAWSRVVRGALVWCGAADPLPTRKTATESDDTKNLLAMLITGLEEADPDSEGITVKEIERLVTHRPDETPTCPTLLEAAAEICGDRFNGRRFGKKLKSFVGRPWEGRKIYGESSHGKVMRWMVKKSGMVGMGGSAKLTLTRVSDSFLNNAYEHNMEHDPYMGSAKTDPTYPPNPPCPKCKGVLKTGPEVRGWVNIECTNCDYIKPQELNRVEA